MRLDDLRNLSPVFRPGLGKSRIIIAQPAILAGSHPQRESSRVGLGIDVGAWTDQEIETEFLCQCHDRHKIVRAILEVEGAWGRFVVTPAVVDAESIEAGRFDLFQQVAPEFGPSIDPSVMERVFEDKVKHTRASASNGTLRRRQRFARR